MSDPTTTLRGEWAPMYAERLPLLAGVASVDFGDPESEGARAFAAFGAPFGDPEPTDAATQERRVDGPHGPIPVRIYRPASGEPSGAGLVWCHGGGFLAGDLDMPEGDLVARGLVTRAGCVVVSVDYRLCRGGVRFPVPDDDCRAAYVWTREHAAELGIDPARIAIGGASAGGNLAASLALRARDEGTPPWQALLAYPVVHPVLPEPSDELAACLAQLPEPLGFPPPTMTWMSENYLGGPVETAVPHAFPGLAEDLTGYPDTYIENCEFDDLRSSGEAFAERLRGAGVDVEQTTAAGVPHGHLNAIGSPLTHATLDRFAARLTRP